MRQRTFKKNLPGYLLIAPAVIAILCLSIYPLFRGIAISFSNYDMSKAMRDDFGAFAGLANYFAAFQNPAMGQIIQNTIVWTITCLSLEVLLGLTMALTLNEKFKGRGMARVITMLPWAIPSAISALTFSALYEPSIGAFNTILIEIGILSEPMSFLGNAATAMPAVIIASVWKSTPFLMIFILAALQGISHDLYESANIDGAGKIQRFFYITLPSIKEPITVAIILNTITVFNNFNAIWLLTQGGPLNSTDILYTQAYREAFVNYEFGNAAALSVVIFLVIAILTTVYIKLTKDD